VESKGWAQYYTNEWCRSWQESFARISAFWRREAMAKPIVRYGSPIRELPAPTHRTDWESYHADPQTVFQRIAAQLANTEYCGEALPCISAYQGHTAASFLGSPHRYDSRTIWTEPCLERISDEFDVAKWRTDTRWIDLKRMLSYYLQQAHGRCGVGYGIGCVVQAIALMRGTANFLTDLVDSPEAVESFRDRLLAEWLVRAEELEAMLPEGAGRWIPFSIWAPGRSIFSECDVSALFSERMFRRFVVPEVQAMARWAEFSFYHLDGPGADKHLDALLEIPELDCIQWIRGAGGGRAADWLPLLKRIQHGGKRLYVECPVSEPRTLLRHLSPDGLMLDVEGCVGRREAEEVTAILSGQ